MKCALTIVIRSLLLGAMVPLATAACAWQTVSTALDVSPNIEIITELRTKLDAASAKTGAPVRLKLLYPILAGGRLAVGEGATVVAHVTRVVRRRHDSPHSCLGVKIDRAEWRNNFLPFDAVIVGHSRRVWKITREYPGSAQENSIGTTPGMRSQPAPSATSPERAEPSRTLPVARPGTTRPIPEQDPSGFANTRNDAGRSGDVIWTYGPRAVDVLTFVSPDPNVGTEFRSNTREVVLPKGILLVLKAARKP